MKRRRLGTITVAHATAIAKWRAADPSTRGPYPVDPGVAPSNGTNGYFAATATIRVTDKARACARDACALKRSRDALGLPRDDVKAMRRRVASQQGSKS